MYRNYAPTIHIQKIAQTQGCQQVLWLYGDDKQMTEAGTMNFLIYWINSDGGMSEMLFIVLELNQPNLMRLQCISVVRKRS